MSKKGSNVKIKIAKVEVTDETLSSRGGLSLIARYISSSKVTQMLADLFSFLRKSSKGAELLTIFHQIICFFFDGTAFHLKRFDDLAKDEGYTTTIETPKNEMVSSHTVKRFFNSFSKITVRLFRKILQSMFIWRLNMEKPEIIKLGMDNEITRKILKVKKTKENTISSQAIITLYHERARDELVNRSLKDFGSEQLAFKRFTPNAAFYYMMLISFFLFETFKQDIDSDTIPVTWYASTFRRQCIDIAAKIIKTGRILKMKISRSAFDAINFELLWKNSICQIPIG